ncbi:MAG: sensor histidine kinase [Sphingomonadaceae bacterium]
MTKVRSGRFWSRARGRSHRGSLTRRMIGVAALWIVILLFAGGLALDRVLTSAITRNFDAQLEYVLTSLLASAEIGPEGEVLLSRAPADQRFLEPYSGLYFQITADGAEAAGAPSQFNFPSRSLWDRRLRVRRRHDDFDVHFYDSMEFAGETIRVAERDVQLPGSDRRWHFQVAQDRSALDEQIALLRRTMIRSFAILGLGLVIMAAIQALYGLWPLRRVREEIAAIRSGRQKRIEKEFPREIEPLVEELNELLAHTEVQAEEARRHAGNLAHALKTPLTVITNAATAGSPDLDAAVVREARVMRRQIDHHLARARAIGRRSSGLARAALWPALEAVERAVTRLYEEVTIDVSGERHLSVRVERQDLDEMLGNLVENAAKYGAGRVFVTVAAERSAGLARIDIEDDGSGIPEAKWDEIFGRGARLDIEKPGTGLGLAIVRDVAEIYGGTIELTRSEDLGGLLARLRLPLAE